MTDQEKAEALWAEALASPNGVKIETDDVQRLVAVLYEYKRHSDDPRLLAYSIAQRGALVLIAKTRPDLKVEGAYRPLEV